MIRSDGSREHVTVAGHPQDPLQINANGTVAQSTVYDRGDTETEPIPEPRCIVLRPGANDANYVIDGFAYRGVKIADNGDIAQTTYTEDGPTEAERFVMHLTVIHPDGSRNVQSVVGRPRQGAQVGADGTFAQTTATSDDGPEHPVCHHCSHHPAGR